MNFRLLESISAEIYDTLPIWMIYIITIFILFLSFEIGYRISSNTEVRNDKMGFNSTGPMVSGLLGMLAFVLAFTFAMASSQHNLRKQYVIEEANIIGTAYLRADLLEKQDAIKIKELLKEYVDDRIHLIESKNLETANRIMKSAYEIQRKLWEKAIISMKNDPNISSMLFIESINQLIDSHTNRVTVGLHNRIPSTILYMLLIISSLTMITMGYQAKLSKSRRLIAVIPLLMAFSALTTLVIDLDRPQQGMITVGQESMKELQKSF